MKHGLMAQWSMKVCENQVSEPGKGQMKVVFGCLPIVSGGLGGWILLA